MTNHLTTNLMDIYRVENFIDTFALGHYARVLGAFDHRREEAVAFKVMRTDHLQADGDASWEYRAFGLEADLLCKLTDSPHIIDLLDCGYISSHDEVPGDGEMVSYGRDVKEFAQVLPDYAQRGWRPYLSLIKLPRTKNLFYLMKPTQQGVRWRLPTEEGLALAVQFAQTLQLAHRQGIAYLDHKLEHLYWDGIKLQVIDLNSSRQLEEHGAANGHHLRMDIHNLCVGILYPIFTGLSPQQTMLRPQPGNRADVESRYQDVTTLDFGVEPTLSKALQDVLQKGAAMQIETIDDFLVELQQVAALHGWDFRNHYTSTTSREARDQMRAGLRKLREGQTNLREARDHFRDAAILDDITEDLEGELRRLVKAANAMLNYRVIP
jgi:serine/threonine protein kinase